MRRHAITPVLLYALGAALDVMSTYLALELVPEAYETNPLVARYLYTPVHAFLEAAALLTMLAVYLTGVFVERINRRQHPRLGRWARRIIHAAVALTGAWRMLAAANNFSIIFFHRGFL